MTGTSVSRARLHFAATAQSVGDLLQQSAASHADIVRHCAQVMSSSAPVLIDAPDWYGAFLDAWSTVAERARSWADTIAPQITVLPQLVSSFGTDVAAASADLAPSLAALAADPSDAAAHNAIAARLRALASEAKTAAASLGAFQSQLQTLSDQMTPDLNTLRGYLASAQQSVGQDIEAVNKLASDIDALKSRIDDLQTRIAVLGTAGTLAIVVMVVALNVEAAEPGGLSLVPFAAAAGAAAAEAFGSLIVLDAEVRALRQQIDEDSAQMSEVQAQISALKIFGDTLEALIDALAQSATDMSTVLEIWSALSTDAAQMQNDVATAQKDLDAGAVADLRQELASAADHWAAVQPLAAGMTLLSVTILPTQPFQAASGSS